MPALPIILLILLDGYALLSLLREKATIKRTAFWVAAILLFPAIGSLVYLFFFRRLPEK